MTEVIVMTAYGTIESAVEAMRLGAFDYIQKPFTEQELLVKVERANHNRRLANEVQLLASEFKERYKFENIAGRSQAVREVLGRIVKVAPTDATVLITGETAPAKSSWPRRSTPTAGAPTARSCPSTARRSARRCWRASSSATRAGRSPAPSARARASSEEADGGTFFFDEIAETPLTFQAKLLRAIQENEIRRVGENKPIHIDVRIIAATNQELLTAVAEKRFRQDLYYRLNVARFVLPPLRDRREDIAVLLEFFLEKYNRKMNTRARFSDGVVEAVTAYDFPGNIRELENMVEQAVALSGGGPITADDVLPATLQPKRPSSGGRTSPTWSTPPSGRRSRPRCATATAAARRRPRCLASARQRSGAR